MTTRLRWFGVVVAALLAAGACGSSGSPKASSDNGSSTTRPAVAPNTEDIASLTPMDQSPDQGATRLHFKIGPFVVEPGQNNIANRSARSQQPQEDGWIVGIRPNLEYANGETPGVDVIHLHHAVWLNLSAQDTTDPALPERFFAVGEEKTNLKFPQGYGYAYKATDRWLLDYMIHNLTSKRDTVWVSYDIDFIPATSPYAKNIKPARPIWMDVENGEVYPVFDVLRKGLRWRGPIGPSLITHLSGRFGAPSWSASAYLDPDQWALELLGFGGKLSTPSKREIQRTFRRLIRDAHPDHGAETEGAAQRISELTEARRILLK